MSSSPAVQSATQYLVPPDATVETDGKSAAFDLGPLAGKQLVIVLRITDIVEQESLHVSIWGSGEGNSWGEKPLFAFPQKFYRGTTPVAVDLAQRPEIKFLQARWELNRWGRGYPRPYFKFSVEIQELTNK
ncbi:MAG: hypothetical protein ACE145_20180 [Terriglobia bacterium]